MLPLPDVSDIIARALAEDLGVAFDVFLPAAPPDPLLLERDVTSFSVLAPEARFEGRIVARDPLVLAGLPVAAHVWSALARAVGEPDSVDVTQFLGDGVSVGAGTACASVSGPARIVLAGERTALDFLMVLCGIATQTARWQAAAGPHLAVCDTRKTVPGLRELSKYAVRVGGGTNHRSGLWDMVLVKDNHIQAAGGIGPAVEAARARRPDLLIEVEAETIGEAVEAVRGGADMVLLDNMDAVTLTSAVVAARQAAALAGRSVLTEASGGITFDQLPGLRKAGVDRVSSSAITLAPPVDIALDEG